MTDMQRGCRRVDSNVYTNAFLSEQPVKVLASAVNAQYNFMGQLLRAMLTQQRP